jgi:hypothetical protein
MRAYARECLFQCECAWKYAKHVCVNASLFARACVECLRARV